MHFYLITFLLSILMIPLTWTSWASNKLGITNVFQLFHETAAKNFSSQGLSIFAFAFFLHAILQSRAFQALFTSQREWLQKRKYLAIGLITIGVAILSSQLSWFDEFVHFYPLIIPLIMAMGFDVFSSTLCLYGGSVAGLMGLTSSERMRRYFDDSFGNVGENIDYSGTSGMGFRIISFLLFSTIIILFNIWYCSRNKKKLLDKENNLVVKEGDLPFNRTRKIILAVAGFFLLGSVLGQISPLANLLSPAAEKVPSWISSEYKERKYYQIGRMSEMEIFKFKEKKKGYWGTFGKWEGMAIDCWFIIGAIIICRLAKLNIMGNLVKAIQSSIPILLIYIFSAVPAKIIENSGLSNSLAEKLLPTSISPTFKYLALFSVFSLSVLFTFFLDSTSIISALVSAFAPTLLVFSDQILIYAAIFSWLGGMIGMAFSPNNGILAASLEKNKISYKYFIKKTWLLAAVILVTAFSLVTYWTTFKIN